MHRCLSLSLAAEWPAATACGLPTCVLLQQGLYLDWAFRAHLAYTQKTNKQTNKEFGPYILEDRSAKTNKTAIIVDQKNSHHQINWAFEPIRSYINIKILKKEKKRKENLENRVNHIRYFNQIIIIIINYSNIFRMVLLTSINFSK